MNPLEQMRHASTDGTAFETGCEGLSSMRLRAYVPPTHRRSHRWNSVPGPQGYLIVWMALHLLPQTAFSERLWFRYPNAAAMA